MLNYFNIPSLTTFEEKMSSDPEFRKKVADDPKTSDYVAGNYMQGDEGTPEKDSGGTDLFGGIASLGALKLIARLYA